MTTQTPDSKPRALIAMSGGVDSSVAAWLMQQAGYDCTGITMRLTRNETLGQSGFHTCCSEKDIEDAAEVAFAMDIPYEVLDFTADFREQIIEKFVRVYEAGGTPNPCIDCNRYMKFRHLLDWAQAHGMEYVVTGHYARVERNEATGRFLLKKGLDEGKDQSYVLYNLTQEQLAHIRLPLGGLHKTEVREIAEQHRFVNARKHDSQDICFVPDGDYARFMEQFTGKHYPAGDFLDQSGKVVGTHSGAVRYTLGQRKGLGLALGAPVYVCGKDMQANTVTVGPESELFDRIGGFDERMTRNQDNELNFRIRKNGGKIYLNHNIRVQYYCRDTMRGIMKMGFMNGKWNVITMTLVPGSMGVRHFVPLAFVLSTILLVLLTLITRSMLFGGLLALEWGAYLLLDFFYSYTIAREKGWKFLPVEVILYPAFHFAYGFGSLSGIIALPGFIRKEKEKKAGGRS